ncbi:MAG: hypothetical protein J6U01_07250 [Clostridia bacterium]|nr:hypothetical protein [Clostridia bacterium]
MKKFFALILILSVLFSGCAFADTESELIGTWVGSSEFYYGEVTYFLVRLYDDHTALYESNKIEMYEMEGNGFVHNSTWELKEDGVHVYHENFWDSKKTDDFLLELTQSHHLAHALVDSYIIFVKLPERRNVGTFHTVSSWDD